jgi:ribonuclease-3
MTSASTNSPLAPGRSDDLQRLQQQIGYYFRDLELLRLALTHKSFAKHNNERLEFIGDAVLGYIVGSMLYRDDAGYQEDVLSLMRAKLVRGSSLASMARNIGLPQHIRLGVGERKSGGRERDSILADAFEAVIGAIHEDGGVVACTEAVGGLFRSRLLEIDPEDLKDAKTKLQEHLQGRQLARPDYTVTGTSGADHARRYTVVCSVPGLGLDCEATASSRRRAEQGAARRMLNELLQQHE